MRLGDRRRSEADGSRAAPDQHALAFLQPQRFVKRAPGGLKHLGNGAEKLPVKHGSHGLHLRSRNAGVFGIAAVELSPHASHRGRDEVAFAELASWRVLDEPSRLDAENARKPHRRRMALSREQLGAVEAEGLDLDQNLAGLRHRHGTLLELEHLRSPSFMDHRGLHRHHGIVSLL
jgi:hypothetical protein